MGISIRIENSSYLSNSEMNMVHIESGTFTDLQIDRSFKFIIPRPYSNCDLDLITHQPVNKNFNYMIFDKIAKSDYMYTQEFCLAQCNQYMTIQACNCSDAFIISQFETAQSCETPEQIKCLNKFLNRSILDTYNFCYSLCPLQCNKTEFMTTISSVKLIGDAYVDYIKENEVLRGDFPSGQIDANVARKSFIRLNIYYDSLSYTHSSETPKIDVVSLISFIGGTLSLFLGVNVFSISEFVEVILEISFIKRTIKS